jgi:hypothetical protein
MRAARQPVHQTGLPDVAFIGRIGPGYVTEVTLKNYSLVFGESRVRAEEVKVGKKNPRTRSPYMMDSGGRTRGRGKLTAIKQRIISGPYPFAFCTPVIETSKHQCFAISDRGMMWM